MSYSYQSFYSSGQWLLDYERFAFSRIRIPFGPELAQSKWEVHGNLSADASGARSFAKAQSNKSSRGEGGEIMNSLEGAEDVVDLSVDLLELRGHGHVGRHGGPLAPKSNQVSPWPPGPKNPSKYGDLLTPPFPVGSGGCGGLQPSDAERDRRRRRRIGAGGGGGRGRRRRRGGRRR